MKKRILAAILCLAILTQAALAASLSNFTEQRKYSSGQFTDVAAGAWYAENVASCYALGLIDGRGDGLFVPSGRLTIAESIKVAVDLRSIYETGEKFAPTPSATWYAPYVVYAIQKRIIASDEYVRFDAEATRSDFAKMIAAALPAEALTQTSAIADGSIPDVSESYDYGAAVYRLYRAGVLNGSGENGAFLPGLPITRAEAATILLRAAKPEHRIMMQRTAALTPEEIYDKAMPAVLYIEVFNADGTLQQTGSGFVITSDGLAVTNCHVIANFAKATATLANGEKREVIGLYGIDIVNDCALIQLEGKGYATLEIGDYSPRTGADVYTIGNPLGMMYSFSRGIVSTAKRDVFGVTYIQIDAPISSGSSGGALLDAAGRVIGITSAGISGGQSLNLAIPIGAINAIDRSKVHELGTNVADDMLYAQAFPIPDFGAYSGIEAAHKKAEVVDEMYYDFTDLSRERTVLKGYGELLEKYGFIVTTDREMTYGYHAMFDVAVAYWAEGTNKGFRVNVELYY